MTDKKPPAEEYFEILKKFAARKGLIYNPDTNLVMKLVEGLLTNKNRYGYPSCPCRLAEGVIEADKDIICPCEYSPPDIEEFGKCYCGLYVSQDYADGKIMDRRVPERRPSEKIFRF